CLGLDPRDWSLRNLDSTKPEVCSVRNMVLVARREPDDVLDNFVELTSPEDPDSPITIRPMPRVTQRMPGGGTEAPMACDPELGRVYVGSAFLGYVVAYRLDGHELWRLSLSGFQTVIGKPLEDASPRGFLSLQESEGSICCRMAALGP